MASANEEQKATEQQEVPAEKKWGTHMMGAPATPTVHPDNQQAALWQAEGPQQPYVLLSPVERPAADNPLEHVVNVFNSWTHKADEIARNVWHNCKLYKFPFYCCSPLLL